jgi:hypothetical protein
MKKIILLFAIVGTFAFQGCTGPEGPQGVTGYSAEAEIFEVTASFSASNNFEKLVTLNPAILNSDMVLVYRLFDVVNGLDVWRSLPQTVYLPQGELDYNFDFTKNDINIFLDSNFDLTTLSPAWAQNQVFRIVIIPGYLSNKNSKTIDLNDYNAVVKAFNINKNQIKILK